jgi:D-tyrosyl-tRNA(Tyr) deacylase
LRVVVQRVTEGGVKAAGENYERNIGVGVVVLLGIKTGDSENDVNFLADKVSALRIFPDANGKMNLSLKNIKGEALIISQFTLYGDASRGNRPGFTVAAGPETAVSLYEQFIHRMKLNLGDEKVGSGIFGAMMELRIINDGPVTIIIDSK